MAGVVSNMVLGTIRGYQYEQLVPFLNSFEAKVKSAELHFLYDDLSQETLQKLRSRGIKLVPFHKITFKSPFSGRIYSGDGRMVHVLRLFFSVIANNPFLSKAYRREQLFKFGELFFNVFSSRYIVAYKYLRSMPPGMYQNVLLTDVRDVVFQGDPFEGFSSDSLQVSNEAAGLTLDTCKNNREWVEKGFGTPAYEAIRSGRLSCAGVTLGPFDKVLDYLQRMSDVFITLNRHVAYYSCFDQGAHNYLLLNNQFPKVERMENLESRVLTMGGMKRSEILENGAGQIVNRDGSPIPLLHQYDRHADLKTRFEKLFCR